MTEYQMWAIVMCALIGAVTFIIVVRMSQRHYLTAKKLDVELETIRLQEKQVNGPGADGLMEEAKQVERIARARDKEAKALERINEAKVKALEPGDG